MRENHASTGYLARTQWLFTGVELNFIGFFPILTNYTMWSLNVIEPRRLSFRNKEILQNKISTREMLSEDRQLKSYPDKDKRKIITIFCADEI